MNLNLITQTQSIGQQIKYYNADQYEQLTKKLYTKMKKPFKPRMNLLVILMILSLLSLYSAKQTILSSAIRPSYTQYSTLKQIPIRFLPSSAIYQNDIFLISFNQPLQAIPSGLDFSLVDQSYKQYLAGRFLPITDGNIATFGLTMFQNALASTYICQIVLQNWYFNKNYIQNQWLTLNINFALDLSQSLSSQLASVNIAILSSLDINHLEYQSNNGFSYFAFTNLLALTPQQLIAGTISNSVYGLTPSQKILSNQPGAVYPVYLQLIPSIDYSDFTLNIELTTQLLPDIIGQLTPPPQVQSFVFQSSCSFLCLSSVACLTPSSCLVSSSRITITLSSTQVMKTGLKYVFKFNVLNPPYYDAKNILLWVDDQDTNLNMVNVVSQLITNKINIIEDQLRLFWGIPQTQVSSTMGLGFFKGGGLNTVEVGFTIDKASPFSQLLQVQIYIGSSQLILQSINHNLPSSNTIPYYQFLSPYLTIKNITSLTAINYRYWISFRTRYEIADILDQIGSVSIFLQNYATRSLFVPLNVNRLKNIVLFSDFRDLAGYHNVLNRKNLDTIIVSSTDNGIENGTAIGINNHFTTFTSVGIDPSINNQQLMFFMNVPLAKMSSGAGSQTYETRIFFNPNVFTKTSPKGLQVVSYNSITSQWSAQANPCYVDQSTTFTMQTYMCQKFDDHVYGQQIDNTLNVLPMWNYYSFVCGQGNQVRCLQPSCQSQCQLFKGLGVATGSSGIAAIRNVSFVNGYQSPIQAGNMNLDFIVAFYQGGSLVSASLINSHTLNFKPLTSLTSSLLNTYHDTTNFNPGNRIPTLLRLKGNLQLSQFVNLGYPNKIRVYLPTQAVGLTDFVQQTNIIGCSFNCQFSRSFSNAITENLMQMHSITVSNIPTLINQFQVFIPIQTLTKILSFYVAFQANGKIKGIYRFGGGSAINQSLVSPLTYFFQPSVYAFPWSLVSSWVISGAYSYSQQINLQNSNFSTISTLVQMQSSSMPLHTSPITSVSIKKLGMLTPYTQITVGSTLTNRSCSQLTYQHQQQQIQIALCEMFSNVNNTNNDILIQYPYFQNNDIGPGYPFDLLFAYSYADQVTGKIEGFRLESNQKLGTNLCKTSKATEYNIGQVGRQSEVFKVQIDPILLSASTYRSIRLQLTIPSNIKAADCSILQLIKNSSINCIVISFFSPIVLELSIQPLQTVSLISFQLQLNCLQTGVVALAVGVSYNLIVQLPHTTPGNQKAIYGSLFTTYKSNVYSCTNSFTYINSGYIHNAVILNHTISPVALNLNTQLEFYIKFNQQKGDLLANSLIQISFTGISLTEQTFCQVVSFEHQILTRTYTVNKYVMIIDQLLNDFTVNIQNFYCSNLVLIGSAPTVIVRIIDVAAANIVIALSNTYSLTYVFPIVSTSVSTITATITSKNYGSLGFNAEYTFNIPFSGVNLIQGFIDLSSYNVDQRLLRCRTSTGNDVFCRKYATSVSNKDTRTNIIYFKTYFATSFTTISLILYPIYQEMFAQISTIQIATFSNGIEYYSLVSDSLAAIVTNDPILITDINLTAVPTLISVSFNLVVMYSVPANLSPLVYIELCQIFISPSLLNVPIFICIINSTIIPCNIIEKNLLQIDTSSIPHLASQIYQLRIEGLIANYQVMLNDEGNFFIRIFTIDIATKQVDYVSVMHEQYNQAQYIMSIILSYRTISNTQTLIWDNIDQNGISFIPIIYHGYYKNPIRLKVIDGSKFTQTFTLQSVDYPSQTFTCEMGYDTCYFNLSALFPNIVSQQITFIIASTLYSAPVPLLVQISFAVCTITSNLPSFSIVQLGLSLPIIFDFTLCRPINSLILTPSLNSSQVKIQTSLSTPKVNYSNPFGIIVVKHVSTLTVLKNFLLNVVLSGVDVSYFNLVCPILIQMVNQPLINVQAKFPQILSLLPQQASIQIQCNQPSTVYWTLGFNPLTLGVDAEDIQTRLLNGNLGLNPYLYDSLNFGNLQYGLNYTQQGNTWKQLALQNLIGSTQYSFKYFCQSMKGTFSDGQIVTFTTPGSIYLTVKVSLGFKFPLKYKYVNNYACAISESLIIPYNNVVNSVNSNCIIKNSVYINDDQNLVWDQLSKGIYTYHFYINTISENSSFITSTLRQNLMKTKRILLSELLLWSSFKAQIIFANSLIPHLSSPIQYQITTSSISLNLPIFNQNSYITMGLIAMYFDGSTMSIPSIQLLKQGKFSDLVSFNQVHMKYTTNNKSIQFMSLTAQTNYSIFYVISVDDVRINAKSTSVQFINFMTQQDPTNNLFAHIFKQQTLIFLLILLLIIKM